MKLTSLCCFEEVVKITDQEFKTLEIGDAVTVVDHEKFTNKKLRTSIGKTYFVHEKKTDMMGDFVMLRDQNGEVVFGCWTPPVLEFAVREAMPDINEGMTMLFE